MVRTQGQSNLGIPSSVYTVPLTMPRAPRNPAQTILSHIAAHPDEGWRGRSSAAAALVELGQQAIPDLLIALGDRSTAVRQAAIYALGHVGGVSPERVVTALASRLQRGSWAEQDLSSEALTAIGTPALPALQTLARDSNELVRWQAERTIRNLLRAHPSASASR